MGKLGLWMGILLVLIVFTSVVTLIVFAPTTSVERGEVSLSHQIRWDKYPDLRSLILKVEVNQGNLQVGSPEDSSNLFSSQAELSSARGKPVLVEDYQDGVLTIRYSTSRKRSFNIGVGLGGRSSYQIDLGESQIPLQLSIDFGAGKGDIVLKGVNLYQLRVDGGAGNLKIDLSGLQTEAKDIDISLNYGVGKVYLLLPSNAGVKVKADVGVGSIKVGEISSNGLGREISYVSPDYDLASIRFNIDADMGVGDIGIVW